MTLKRSLIGMNSSAFFRISICFFAILLSSLSLLAKAQENDEHNAESKVRDFQFPTLIGLRNDDFVVKFKNELISLRNISELFRQQNVTVPNEKEFFTAILKQKNSPAHSCRSRCYAGERRQSKSCYCDRVCETFGDCCIDFYSRCNNISSSFFTANIECGEVDSSSWSSGVVMRSTCDSSVSASTKECHPVQRLNFAPQKELPVYGWKHNLTYRSIACARCNNETNTSFWGLDISCDITSGPEPVPNITIIKKFLEEYGDCSWKYLPTPDIKKYQQSCVIHDSPCSSKEHRMPSVVKQLCALYAMTFIVSDEQVSRRYRNPHCAFCNPEGRLDTTGKTFPSVVPPLSILLDISKNIEEPPDPKPEHPTNPANTLRVSHDIPQQALNCSSNFDHCTVLYRNKTCRVFYLVKNQPNQTVYPWNESFVMLAKNQTSYNENVVHILCPDHPTRNNVWENDSNENGNSALLVIITFTGMLLSISSLCFLLLVYVSFDELKNLPGRCVINLSVALLLYQVIFLCAKKSTEVDALCKAVAILLHFYILSTFAWMSTIAFDAAITFSTKVTARRRQPSDTRKILIKYFIVGWGLPLVVVGLCSALDLTGTFHIGYGNPLYCWISDAKALTVTMGIPVSTALVFNILCFAKNIYAIHHLQRAADMATSNSPKASLTLICIKLTTVLGLTWILALASNWKQTDFLQYPSTVLNSLQGFSITLCFVTTKRVRSLLKNRFSKRRNMSVEAQPSSSHEHHIGLTEIAESAAGLSAVPTQQTRRNLVYTASRV